jgi:hypothetical protein
MYPSQFFYQQNGARHSGLRLSKTGISQRKAQHQAIFVQRFFAGPRARLQGSALPSVVCRLPKCQAVYAQRFGN